MAASYVTEGELKHLRDGGYRDQLKGRRVQVLDGKHIGRIGVFVSWRGTVAFIRFDGESNPTGLSTRRRVGLLRR